MSRKELHRKSVLELVVAKRLSLVEASKRMNLSYRQTLRVYARFSEQGDAGLVHRRRGQSSNRAYAAAFRDRVLQRYRERYKPHDVGPTLAAEKLAKEGLGVDHETLRRWLLEQGDWNKRRKRRTHRTRRERRAHFGELVQMDGSHHRWFGPECPEACLMNMVDDAKGATLAFMAEEETTEAAMRCLWQWIERYGIPKALYTDKKNVFVTNRDPTIEEQLAGQEPLTAFGRACDKLGIDIVTAHSPQAKGRVERSHGVYQDRLVKELALRRITTIKGANNLLANGFVKDLNAKFEREPRIKTDFHEPVPKAIDLAHVFCFEQTRQVQNDWTIQYENRCYQIARENQPLPKPKDKVIVRILLEGTMHLIYKDKSLAFSSIARPEPKAAAALEPTCICPKSTVRIKHKPAPNHPWRTHILPLAADKARQSK